MTYLDNHTKINIEMLYESGYSQEFLMEYYLGTPLTNSKFSNPYREDNNPSCTFYYYNNKLYFKDWTTYFWGTWIQAAGLYYGIIGLDNSFTTTEEYYTILSKAYNDIVVNKVTPKLSKNSVNIPTSSLNPVIEVKIREWTIQDLDYWYPITLPILCKNNVYAIERVYYNDVLQSSLTHTHSNPTYGYRVKQGEKSNWVIYKPLDITGHKWRKNIPINTILGYDVNNIACINEPKILTKSLKDAMVITMATGLISYTYQSELYTPEYIEENTIGIIYDNDDTGQKRALELSDKFNIPNIVLTGGKDAFVISKQGLNELKKQIKL